MILEVAVLNIKSGLNADFEQAFAEAQKIISAQTGYVSHELQKCIEVDNQYVLLVKWQTLEDHTEGFRGSADYETWRQMLHHFYDPFPVVEHYQLLSLQGPSD